jgi:hypothetical protein
VSSQYIRINSQGREQQRAPLLERLIARADAKESLSDWRAEAFKLIAPDGLAMPPIAATALCAEHNAVDAAWVCLATPVHLVAGMTHVRLSDAGIVSIPSGEAEALARDFNDTWRGSGIQLRASQTGQLFCLFDRPIRAATCDPREALGQSIEEFLPTGEGSAPLRRLISETEMWLFQRSGNQARSESESTANGLWFWGGGPPLKDLPALAGWVGGNDVFFSAFGARDEPGAGSGVVTLAVVPGGAEWQHAESRWLRPAVAQLRRGGLSSVTISVNQWRFTLNSRTLRRFWRRRKPWWESLG